MKAFESTAGNSIRSRRKPRKIWGAQKNTQSSYEVTIYFTFWANTKQPTTATATTAANSSNSEKCLRSTRLHTAPAVERVLDGLARNSFYFIMFFVRPSLADSVAHSLTNTHAPIARFAQIQYFRSFYYYFLFHSVFCSAAFGSKTTIFSWIRGRFVRTWAMTTVKSLFLLLWCFGALAVPGDGFCADSVPSIYYSSISNNCRCLFCHRPSTRFVYILLWHFLFWPQRMQLNARRPNRIAVFNEKNCGIEFIVRWFALLATLTLDFSTRIRDFKWTNGFVVDSCCDRTGEIA